MVRKILFALLGVPLFMLAGPAQASLIHEIYFLRSETLTASSTFQNDLDQQIVAIGTLNLDSLAENGGFSCLGNCADLVTLEIEIITQPDLTASLNTAPPPTTYTAEVQRIDLALVNNFDWSLTLQEFFFTVPVGPTPNILNLSPAATPGFNTNGDNGVVYSTGDCRPLDSISFCAVLGVTDVVSMPVHGVPEPTTLALLSLGLAGLGFTRRKMKKKQESIQ